MQGRRTNSQTVQGMFNARHSVINLPDLIVTRVERDLMFDISCLHRDVVIEDRMPILHADLFILRDFICDLRSQIDFYLDAIWC